MAVTWIQSSGNPITESLVHHELALGNKECFDLEEVLGLAESPGPGVTAMGPQGSCQLSLLMNHDHSFQGAIGPLH